MFFSWLFLLFLASYGFSEAQSDYVAESYGPRSLEEMDLMDSYAQFRAQAPEKEILVRDSLKSAVDVLQAAMDTTNGEKKTRSGYRSNPEQILQAKLKIAQEYEKKLEQESKAKARKSLDEFDYYN